jgi:hypothetical protein
MARKYRIRPSAFAALGTQLFPHRWARLPAYSPRIVDAELRELLGSTGAVVIEGPKACGKTMTASRQASSRVLLSLAANWWRLLYEPRPPERLRPTADWRLAHEWPAANAGTNYLDKQPA